MSTNSFELLQKASSSAMALRATTEQLGKGNNPNLERIAFQAIPGLDPTEEGSRETLRAESFHRAYFAHSQERENALRERFEKLGRPKHLIVMICCRAHFPFLKLWLSYCVKHGIHVRDRTLVFTLDEHAQQQTEQLGLSSFYLDPALYQAAGNSNTFGDPDFSGTMYYKNAVIHDCLKLGANLLFQDVDLIWLQDPIPHLEHNNDIDIQIMFDGHNNWHYPYYANTGFIYLRNTQASKAVFETALFNTSSIFRCGGHQAPLNRIFQHFVTHNVLNLRVLPENLFLNGHLFNLKRGISSKAGEWRENGIVVHYSWTANKDEKLAKLKLMELI